MGILLISCIDSIYPIYIVNLKENDIQTLHALIQYIPYILLISCIDSIYSIYIVNLKENDIQTLHALIQYIPCILLISRRMHIVNLKENAGSHPIYFTLLISLHRTM